MGENDISMEMRMNRLIDDVTVLFTPDEETTSFEERRKYVLQLLDCVVYCATDGKKKYGDSVEQCNHDVVDLEHLYVFKKTEEDGGRPFKSSVRDIPDKWAHLNSKQLSEELNKTLVHRREQKDLFTMYDTLVQKLGAAKNVLSHMDSRIYTVGKTLSNRNQTNNRQYNPQNCRQSNMVEDSNVDQID